MGEATPEPRKKRLQFVPNEVVLGGVYKLMKSEGHRSEAQALEALTREGLQRRGIIPGPKL